MSRVQSLVSGLVKAKNEEEVQTMKDILDSLGQETITYAILKETKLGKICGGLRKYPNQQIASKAKELVLRWKQQVNREKENNTRSSSNQQSSAPEEPPAERPGNDGFVRRAYRARTGDPRRDKVVEKLSASLRPDVDDESFLHYGEVAAQIERELWSQHRPDLKGYLKHFRDLNFNLKDAENLGLKLDLLNGVKDAATVVGMTTEQLASEKLRQARESEKDWMLKEAQGGAAVEQKAMTDEYKCGKCKQRKCTYYQQQTRGADEPMTTFIRCVVCGNQWKN